MDDWGTGNSRGNFRRGRTNRAKPGFFIPKIQSKPAENNSLYQDYLSLSYEQQRRLAVYQKTLEEVNRRALTVKRVRRIARIMIAATRNNVTARQRRIKMHRQRLRNSLSSLHANQYRIVTASFVVIFGISTFVTPFLQAFIQKPIHLSAEVKNLVGETRDDIKQNLSFDEKTGSYSFAVPKEEVSSESEHTGRNASAYETTIPAKAADGVSVTDTVSNIKVTLRPKFFTAGVRKTDGDHLVYKSGNRQLVYSHKYNGLKEDIVIPEFQSPNMSFQFQLELPSGVEARIDDEGSIGIYSSDPSLFGNITYGSDADREKVERARQNGEKNNLLMTIPYPVVKDSTGKEYTDKAEFKLGTREVSQTAQAAAQSLPADAPAQLSTVNHYLLTLSAYELRDLPYPISIDPTMRVTSSADFAKVNPEGGAELDTTNNLIKRAGLTGGVLPSAATDAASTSAAGHSLMEYYNGRAYVFSYGSAEYATVDANGKAASWTATNFPSSSGVWQTKAQYNGYLYITGGFGNGQGLDQVKYSKINPGGSLSAWTLTGSVHGRGKVSLAVSNGYLYLIAGCAPYNPAVLESCIDTQQVDRAVINSDGTLGSWTNLNNNLPAACGSCQTTVHKGYVYVNQASGVYYAKQNNDGTLTPWQTDDALPSGTSSVTTALTLDGYLYLFGGVTNSESTAVWYAQLNADGSIGTWQSTTPLPAARSSIAATVDSSGNILLAGGVTGVFPSNISYNTVWYMSPKPAGWTETWATTNSMSTARSYAAAVAYHGYLYVIGGCTNQTGTSGSPEDCDAASTSVEYGSINPQTGAITWLGTTTGLPLVGRWGHKASVSNGYVYVTAGCTAGLLGACTHTGDVLYAPITVNGTLGAWTTRTNRITTNRTSHGFTVHGGYGYVVGGQINNSDGYTTSVQYLQFNADGTVPDTNWSSGTSISVAMAFKSLVAHNGYLYYINDNPKVVYMNISSGAATSSWVENSDNFTCFTRGGAFFNNGYFYCFDGNGGSMNGEYAKTNTNGSLTNVSTLPAPGFTRDIDDTMVVYNNFVYTPGSCNSSVAEDCNGVVTTVNYTSINNGGSGTTGSWALDSTDTFTARMDHGVAAHNGYLYVMAGCGVVNDCPNNLLSSVQYAAINTDGTVGAWSTATSYPLVLSHIASVVHKGYLYVSGGLDSTGTRQNSTYYARLESNGNLASDSGCGNTWCQTTSSFTTARSSHSMLVHNNKIYIINGETNSNAPVNDIQVGTISNSGDVTSWVSTTAGPNTVSLNNVNAVVNNGYLYLLGGYDAFGTLDGDVHFAAINSDGTISSGAWKRASHSFVFGRVGSAAVALNGYLYIIGGGYSSSSREDVQYAAFGENGDIGAWQRSSSLSVICDRMIMGAVVYNGKIYQPGGNRGGAAGNTTQFASILSIPRTAQVSKLYDFDNGVRPTKLITRGSKRNGAVVGVTYSSNNAATGSVVLDNSQTITDTGYFGSQAQFLTLGTNRTLSRYFFLRYTIDDSQSAVFPDSGNESTITDFDLYYTANPGSRLRGGRTFTDGVDRGLDAAPQ